MTWLISTATLGASPTRLHYETGAEIKRTIGDIYGRSRDC